METDVEREYGGRFLADYNKKCLLGRGACGAVWLATSTRQRVTVAVKQVAKGGNQKNNSDYRSACKEISVGGMLFAAGGTPRLSARVWPGIQHITRLLDAVETKNDIFLVMEYGGNVLTKALFDIKGEFLARGSFQPRERVYRVHHLPMYEAMKRDPHIFKQFLRQILQAIHVLSHLGIVHADLKPDNLLLNGVDGDDSKCDVRVCDFGSAFMFSQPGQLALATPEYMPPEALGKPQTGGYTEGGSPEHRKSQTWSFDVWSLGAIMLELCYGVPHWLSYKCRVRGPDAKDHNMTGILAMPSRDHDRILQRQKEIVLEGGLRRALHNSPGISLDADGMDLLEALLTWDPERRISPSEALAHPFLNP